MAATHVMQSSSYELSTLISGRQTVNKRKLQHNAL